MGTNHSPSPGLSQPTEVNLLLPPPQIITEPEARLAEINSLREQVQLSLDLSKIPNLCQQYCILVGNTLPYPQQFQTADFYQQVHNKNFHCGMSLTYSTILGLFTNALETIKREYLPTIQHESIKTNLIVLTDTLISSFQALLYNPVALLRALESQSQQNNMPHSPRPTSRA